MEEMLKKLEKVQEVDFQISILRRKKTELPKRLTQFDEEIKINTTKYEEKKKIADEIEKNLRQQNGALELNETRLKRSQEKLEQIKTNQEYQALQKEIESLKKNSAIIQENANKVRTELDGHKKELDALQAEIDKFKSLRETESGSIGQEEGQLDSDLSKLEENRSEAIEGIDIRYLKQYEKIRDARFGIGIVRAQEGCCKGCNMRIPPQVYNEIIRGTELHICPSCKRILFHYQENTPPPGKIESGSPSEPLSSHG